MKIDPAAKPFTAMAAVPTVIAALARRPRTTAALGLLTAGVTLFFRDPDRTPDRSPVTDPDVVLAPADGIVMHVGEPQPGIAPPGEWQQVSIFLSLLDVHMNRSPYGGRVIDVTHTPGRFLAAYRAESATKNERSEIIVERVVAGRPRRIVYRQLVGQLARRIVTRIEPGDEIGDRRAHGPDEVRLAHGRLRAAGGAARGQQGQARHRGRDGAGPLPGGGRLVTGDTASASTIGPRRRDRVSRRIRLVSATGARVIPLDRLNPRVRARATLPSLFTLGNMLCGFSSVLLSFQGHFRAAAVLVGISIVLDICDGAVARAVGAITPFGLQFDSLADLISFGIAPAVLVYTWALPAYPVWAWAGAMFWLACAAYRLARFNVTIDPLADKRYFVGLASPGAAGVVISTVLAIGEPLYDWAPLVPVAAGVVPAALMASSFRFRSFRDLLSPRHLRITVPLGIVIAVGLALFPGRDGHGARLRLRAHLPAGLGHGPAAAALVRGRRRRAAAHPDAVGHHAAGRR